MDMFLLRHGKAERPSVMVPSDHMRRLTAPGGREMERVGRAIKKMGVRPDVLASSPLVRAVQTADIVSGHLHVPVVQWDELKPETPPGVAAKRALAAGADSVMLVGHEPHLSGLASCMISGGGASISIKKGGLVCVRVALPNNAGTLRYALTPKQMAMMS